MSNRFVPRPAGVICPIATPLTEDERLDVDAFNKLIDFVLPNIDGLLVLGTTGEFALLSERTANQAIAAAVEKVDGRVPVYAGIGDTGTQRVLSRSRQATEFGADFLLVTAPYYYMVNDLYALKDHFYRIAENAEAPVLIYNMPNTHNNLNSELIAQLSGHPNIVGLKDSWGDFFQFQEFLRVRDENFSVFIGPEQLFAAALWGGADGLVSALANIVPAVFRQLIDLVKRDDRDGAMRVQTEITDLARIFQYGSVPGALKIVLKHLGIGNSVTAAPLAACNEKQIQSILKIIAESALFEGGFDD